MSNLLEKKWNKEKTLLHFSLKLLEILYIMDRWVTLPKRVISLTWGPPPPCKQAVSVYLSSLRKTAIQIKEISTIILNRTRGKKFEESITTSNCNATLHNGNWYKLSFAELQAGQWQVHVRIVCVSLHQLILGSMNKQSWNWISLVISQLKNFDIFVNKFLQIIFNFVAN